MRANASLPCRRIAGLVVFAGVLASCGVRSPFYDQGEGGTGGFVGAGPFEGSYLGTAQTTQTRDGGTSGMSSSPLRVRVMSGTSSDIALTFGDIDGGVSCTFNARRSGNSATFAPGQVCSFMPAMSITGTFTLDSGSASVNGAALTMNLSMRYSVMMSGFTESGTATMVFTGTRQ